MPDRAADGKPRPGAPGRRARSRRRAVRTGVGALVTLAVVGGATAAVAAGRTGGPRYRTALAAPGDVEQVVSLSGTLEATDDAAVAFPVSGTVKTVAVHVGQQVTAGQVLATLDPAALQAAVTSAQARVAQEQTQLASDEAAQTAATSASRSTSASPSTSASLSTGGTSGAGGRSGSGGGASSAKIASAQQAVLDAQQAADRSLAAARAATATVQAACGTATPVSSGTPTHGSSPPPTPSPTASGAPSAPLAAATSGPARSPRPTSPSPAPVPSSPEPPGTPGADCAGAGQQLLAAAAALNDDQQRLTRAQTQLTALLSSLAGPLSTGGGIAGTTAASTGSSSATSAPGGLHAGGGPSAGGRTVSAADIAADQAGIDAAQAQVDAARQDLQAATLTAPLAGTVVSLGLTPGARTTSASKVRIVGPGGRQVVLAVSEAQVRQLAVGMPARITPDGATAPLTGHVAAISVYGSSGGSSAGSAAAASGSVSYPVTVAVDDSATGAPLGVEASVDVVIGTHHDVLSVPTSALHRTGSGTTVEVLQAGVPVVQRVSVGLVGAVRAEITKGLADGTPVILADLRADVPASNTVTARLGRLGGGGFGGGGFGGGSVEGAGGFGGGGGGRGRPAQ